MRTPEGGQSSSRLAGRIGQILEQPLLTTDAARALRSATALALAWSVCLLTEHGEAAIVAPLVAQNVAMRRGETAYVAALGAVSTAIEALARQEEGELAEPAPVCLEVAAIPGAPSEERLVHEQVLRIMTEVEAMSVAAQADEGSR